ncbi:AAA-domain-containing protein [Daedaleopsis nitida]|nr:AAA-domain-containing protein [Daedaleopsis nitida]
MPRRCRIHFVSLRSSLVNLPISLYGPLVERGIRPQGLAVHLTLVSSSKTTTKNAPTKREAYVGWTGMASASSLAHFNSGDSKDKGLETVEIDPQYAEGLGFTSGDVVEIGLLHDLAFAKSVSTEPVTSDDWEILELHASHVESTLLSQVRVAFVGQEIDVWVLGRTRVRLNVVSLDPSSGKALLLNNSTEVSIAPKLRAKSKSSKGSADTANAHKPVSAANGSPSQATSTAEKPKATRSARTLRLLPQRFLRGCTLPTFNGNEESIAFISYKSLLSLYPQTASLPQLKAWRATVRRLLPPVNPDKEATPVSPVIQPVPRVLIPHGEASTSKSIPTVLSKNEILVVWSSDVPVPDGHVAMQPTCDNAEDWDLVRLTFVEEDTSHPLPPYSVPQVACSQPSYDARSYGLAGVEETFAKCTQFVLTSFAHHAINKRVRGASGLLVTGRSGAGKSALLHAVSRTMQDNPQTLSYILYVDLSRYTGSPIAKVRSQMKYWMEKASWHKPSLLVLDNIDKLLGTELEHAESFHTRHITELFLALFGYSSRSAAPNTSGVVLLAAAESQAALHPLLNSSHLFQEVVHLKPPSKDARKEVLAHLVQEHMESSDITQEPSALLNFTALATQTEGYSVTDLKDLVARAVHRAAIRSSQLDSNEIQQTTLTPADFASAQVDFVPHSLRDVKLQKSDIAWADIGGLRETKRVLRETLEWPTKYGPIFSQSPLRLRSGLLLYGYPGCGKTLLASAVAKECGLNFISIKGPEILNKYIGASEKSVRDLFERASAAKPCVLFFDEFDSIAPKRGHDSTGVTDRVVNQMLTQMDGAEGLEGVYVLAATSRPDLIDSALLRPGRLDKSLLCDMPDTSERKEILEALSRKVAFGPSVDLAALAAATDGFSGADLQALVYNAHLEVVHDAIASSPAPDSGSRSRSNGAGMDEPVKYTVLGAPAGETARVMSRAEESAFQRRLQRIMAGTSTDARRARDCDEASSGGSANLYSDSAIVRPRHEISQAHLERVLKVTRPSVPAEERERLRRIYGAFVSDRSGDLPVPRRRGESGTGHRSRYEWNSLG